MLPQRGPRLQGKCVQKQCRPSLPPSLSADHLVPFLEPTMVAGALRTAEQLLHLPGASQETLAITLVPRTSAIQRVLPLVKGILGQVHISAKVQLHCWSSM